MEEDIIQVQDQFYILATAARADDRTRVLKQGETFAVFDRYGDFTRLGLGEQGLYHEGTRYLSRLELRLGDARPLFLSSTVKESNDLLVVDLTNPDIPIDEQRMIPRGTVHLYRTIFLWNGTCYERFRISNHGMAPVHLTIKLRFAADFEDVFEVRGLKRAKRGERLPDIVTEKEIRLGYMGLDDVIRETRFHLSPAPREATSSTATFDIRLDAQAAEVISATIECDESDVHLRAEAEPGGGRAAGLEPGGVVDGRGRRAARSEVRRARDLDEALELATAGLPQRRARQCDLYTSNEQFNDWTNRSIADLHMMITETPYGPYPYAGVPWFSTAFGRDGIITALQLLWIDPRIARGVLTYLAGRQSVLSDDHRDAEPGKILHEVRTGEMAALGEVPFGLYYGSVDATPLFIILAGAYYRRTADLEFIRSIWPNIGAALEWIRRWGDRDGDGFVEYFRHSPEGLVQQGWKDSADSIFHADGRLAEGPIALCEVQGYVHAALLAAARLAYALDERARGAALVRQAHRLKRAFNASFWDESLSTYVLALDGNKKPCAVRTSNAGQCLFSGIATPERAGRVARTLLGDDSFSGWGIRTLSAREVRYNPMSYHNGSVWPHDNSLIALGMSFYGLNGPILDVLTGLFDASIFVDLHRMPELFCGFKRRAGEGPTLYPVACAPQSWSAAAVFMLIEACLGLHIDAVRSRITFRRPVLPPSLESIRIRKLEVGSSCVDLQLERRAHNVAVHVLNRDAPIEIITLS